MNENLYASPPPVEEEFVLDEITRRNAKSLRITAIGLAVMAVGFAMGIVYLLDSCSVWETYSRFWYEMDTYLPFAADGVMILGGVLCLACGREIVPFGRWMVAGFLLLFFMPLGSVVLWNHMMEMYRNYLLLAMYAGHFLWCLFLWRLAMALKIRSAMVLPWLGFLFWTATLVLIYGNWEHNSLSVFLDDTLSSLFGDSFSMSYGLGSGACILGMLLICGAIWRKLRISQNTENHHE